MSEFFETFLLGEGVFIRFVFSLILAISLGLIIAYIYKLTHKGMNYERAFLSTLITLGPIVTLVMFFIQGDLVLSLGLVGSLSIIRFRTPIKDTKDMVFLFWSIAIGLGVGTNNWTLSIVATIVLSILMVMMYKVKQGSSFHKEYILVITGNNIFDKTPLDLFKEETNVKIFLRSSDYQGDSFEMVYEITFDQKYIDNVHKMVNSLKEDINIKKVSLLSPQLALPM
ncbi:DUF4956 domain-containing protein [Liberiplasma polymorphum]|uniref:DUF4956 domain-containing protein n=1 Tax=Liberiplasma polymorphum TaxID=3374570 RepID=UPI0037748FAB